MSQSKKKVSLTFVLIIMTIICFSGTTILVFKNNHVIPTKEVSECKGYIVEKSRGTNLILNKQIICWGSDKTLTLIDKKPHPKKIGKTVVKIFFVPKTEIWTFSGFGLFPEHLIIPRSYYY